MTTEFRRAVADDLRALCVLHDREVTAEVLADLRASGFPHCLGLKLGSSAAQAASELWRAAFEAIPEDPDGLVLDELAVDYAAIYLNHTYRASPCESVWLDEDGLAMQAPMFAIRRWHERFGARVVDRRTRSEDHIAAQLSFVASLFDAEDATLKDCADFLDEHLLRWVGDFAQRVAHACGTPLYAGLAVLTAAYCEELRDVLSDDCGLARPSPEELAKRCAPPAEPPLPPPSRGPLTEPSW